jgi:hypothetical protein
MTSIQKFIQTKQESFSLNELNDLEDLLLGNTKQHHEIARAMHHAMSKPENRAKMMNAPSIRIDPAQMSMSTPTGEVSIDELKPQPVDVNTLPAVVTSEIRALGMEDVSWTDVDDLPGNLSADVRTLGHAIFKHFGIQEGSAVQTISCFEKSDLLNSSMELNAVLGFLEKHAVKASPDNMRQNFDGTIDGYSPEVRMYYTPKTSYLAVLEGEGQGIEGRYIYAFKRDPELILTHEHQAKLGNNVEQNDLKNTAKPSGRRPR